MASWSWAHTHGKVVVYLASSLPVTLCLSHHRHTPARCTPMGCFCVHRFMCWVSVIVRLWPVWVRRRALGCLRRTMTCTWNRPASVKALLCPTHSNGRWRRYHVLTRISMAPSPPSPTCYHVVISSCLHRSHSPPRSRLPSYLWRTRLPVSPWRSPRWPKEHSCVRLFRPRWSPTRRWSYPWTSRVLPITMPLSRLRWPFLR